MGIKDKVGTGDEKKNKPEETAAVGGETDVSEPTSPPPREEQSSNLPRLDILKAILGGIDAAPQVWPKEALKATLKRFERMPRKGWDLMHKHYTEKFAKEISLCEFRRQAEIAVVSSNGRKCTRHEFTEECSKRVKSMKDFIEENTLSDLKLYTKVRDQLQKELGSIRNSKIEDVQRTRKVYSETLDSLTVELLNQALGEIISKQPVKSWTEVAHMLQATQLAYESITFRPREKSKWSESILKKIESATSSAAILIKARDSKLQPGEEVSKGRKVMRELNLVLDRKDDVIEAISKLNERAAVYQRKLDTHEKRKAFSRANRRYELQRSQFYRDLGGDEKAPIDIEEGVVKDFWSTMWNSTECEQKDYSDYLREYVPDSTSQANYFPSMSEFSEIIRFLPNWKAAGNDGIFNFFIKKCTSLHPSLYDLVKGTCMQQVEVEDWFFKGITYLIPKGTPKQGSDFRPITCMSNLYKLTTKCVTRVMQAIHENKKFVD